MKVLILGAAGRAAHATVHALRFLPGLKRLYLADNNAEALCKISADLAHLPVSLRYLDAENESSLYERMLEADLVLGCLGPFHRHESRIVRAAIAAGRDYLSLCDDPAAVEEVLSQGKEAEDSGIRVLCGCGLTPGLSNLLACRAASRLDRIDSVEFSWFLELGSGMGAATLEHLLRSFAGKAPALQGGKPATARAGSWEEMVEFPSPVGRQGVSYLSHPEPATMPAALAGAKEIWFKAGVGSRGMGFALHSLAWLGEGQRTELWQTVLRTAAMGIARRGESSCLTAVRVTARGLKDGVRSCRALCVMGDYYHLSGLVMAASAASLDEEDWEPGIYTPENVLDDPSVFARLNRAGVRVLLGEEKD
ncbi:MAG: saccharopine dehydrogenase NADP-binding domain-containing protein [Actinobacteria bacterium]|nr:saccharopine dehydrogenase NADP-binding domain-containing protein [Actinomycetota bacterium]